MSEKQKTICYLCKKPIKGMIYYQANMTQFPSHKNCRVVIKRSKDGGI